MNDEHVRGVFMNHDVVNDEYDDNEEASLFINEIRLCKKRVRSSLQTFCWRRQSYPFLIRLCKKGYRVDHEPVSANMRSNPICITVNVAAFFLVTIALKALE